MDFIKKYFKLFVGVGVLILVLVVFFFAKRTNVLETGALKDWRAASVESRMAAAKILTGGDTNVELLVACVTKMSQLPDSGEMAVRDAASLCQTGIKLKENL
ncbi:MAG: hypothetical protein IKZ34_02100 [Alphaproteobacteria bacterium]|nr:hypothetical protein [Alphaproteobacteria bacterium]